MLAIGAQFESGDGDAALPQPEADVWARALFGKAESAINSLAARKSASAYMVKLWLLVAKYYANAGLLEREYRSRLSVVSRC